MDPHAGWCEEGFSRKADPYPDHGSAIAIGASSNRDATVCSTLTAASERESRCHQSTSWTPNSRGSPDGIRAQLGRISP